MVNLGIFKEIFCRLGIGFILNPKGFILWNSMRLSSLYLLSINGQLDIPGEIVYINGSLGFLEASLIFVSIIFSSSAILASYLSNLL